MLTENAQATLSTWEAKKMAQWQRIAGRIPGLQLVRSGEAKSSFMLVCSTESFYEAVLIGQLEQVEREMLSGASMFNPVYRDKHNSVKAIHRQAVDLSDEEIEAVVTQWGTGNSVARLPFVTTVWGIDGKPKEGKKLRVV
jgi:hypothetical protein